ncbi:probable dolichyl pyrophosphate Glc1Man9GlcNAc2 alpha-1,3-glucosyltransferase isoform X1 [Zootermopsis nevadensis]|uniref:Alpha-1,3-glucosyltransferase n=2 Tax=Zootermopsis nevadensis TaxID=136037 RepID=A0A067RF74_ZOONE|nr:probable dolichyl pyrophosphate Glc1Man9GlcNAc2 alpha-1,3-glucosyltransferase isoform X1 [Zootermopsis nevadensis]KDR18773.1 putative dolichyl pyrophosphate Glc1Man9GlcNAc2 alpha-1,3-glucosyltransferase [Zootermopsis nevadensis]
MFWSTVALILCVKLLLIPSYHSTDFEVHRNWLAITHSLPISEWYQEATSEWTLDYPPLFAWFEFILSYFAKYFDAEMLQVKNLNYASSGTILFQRLSVIVTDFVFAYGTRELCSYLSSSGIRKSSKWGSRWGSPAAILQILLLGNAGLLLVDHIHFQYNGFLLGLLLISVARVLQGKCLMASFWFAVLLNLKHIFIYVAPAYFVYLLRSYCFLGAQSSSLVQWRSFSPARFAKLGLVVAYVFLVSFGPFIVLNQLPQVFSRLFPFKRGLCHAYWAPNIWALYNIADKMAIIAGRQLGITSNVSAAVMTGGLVQEYNHVFLPEITPRTTFLCTLLSVLPALVKLWCCPGNPYHFVRCIVLCACGSFMFGWHVHEKAILLIIIPLSFMAVIWKKEAQMYVFLATVGHYSLFPLLFTAFELPIKVLLLVLHSSYAFFNLASLFDMKKCSLCLPLLSGLESVYILGLVPLFVFENVILPLLGLNTRLPFLPLMLTSVYCAVGVLYFWLKYYWHFLTTSEVNHKRKAH